MENQKISYAESTIAYVNFPFLVNLILSQLIRVEYNYF
jgi:hypothetical protein